MSRIRALFVTQCFFLSGKDVFLRSFTFEFLGEERVLFSERMLFCSFLLFIHVITASRAAQLNKMKILDR